MFDRPGEKPQQSGQAEEPETDNAESALPAGHTGTSSATAAGPSPSEPGTPETTTPTDPAQPSSLGSTPSEPAPAESGVPTEIAAREWVERDGVMVEAGNAVWDEHDWSKVPVRAWSDEPPEGWLEQLEAELAGGPRRPELGPIAWLEDVPASAYLMNELENLPDGLVDNDYDALELVAHWSRLVSYAAAKMREAIAELANSEGLDQGLANLDHLGIRVNQPSIASDDLALRLGMGKRAASRLVRSSRMLAGPAGPTAEALETGQIDPAKADIIALGVEDLGMFEALQVQDIVLAKAPHATASAVRREVVAARASVQPERFEERCKRAAQQRRVDRPRALPDGMSSLYALMPAVEANQLYRALDAAARSAKTTGDPRTLDQLRADALALMGSTAVVTGMIGPCPHPSHNATPQQDASPQEDAIPAWAGAAANDAPAGSGNRDAHPVTGTRRSGDALDDDDDDDSGSGAATGNGSGSASGNRNGNRSRNGNGNGNGSGNYSGAGDLDTRGTRGPTAATAAPPGEAIPDPATGPVQAESSASGSPPAATPAAPPDQAAGPPGSDVPTQSRQSSRASAASPPTAHDTTDPPDVNTIRAVTAQAPQHAPGRAPASAPERPATSAPERTAAGAATGTCPTPGQSMRVGQIGGKSAHVKVVVPLTSFMGGEGGPGADLPGSDDPAHLEGYGPIPASVARALAAGGPWARMVTDPVDLSVLELSREQYEPTEAMAELIRARQPECANPSCTASADGCDLHHRIPWPIGSTSVKDIDPNCRRDHLLLTHGGWWYTQQADGSRIWVTATNHTYLQHPDGQITMIRPTHGPGSAPDGDDAFPAADWAPMTDQYASARRFTLDDEPPPF